MVKNIKNSSKHDFYTCFLLRYFQKYTADNINLILSSKVNTSPIIAPLQQWQLQILAEKNRETDKVPEASELWQNQRFYISYIILYIIYTSSIFFYILLWRSSNVCKMQRLIPYTPDLPSFTIFNLWPILLYLSSKPLILL